MVQNKFKAIYSFVLFMIFAFLIALSAGMYLSSSSVSYSFFVASFLISFVISILIGLSIFSLASEQSIFLLKIGGVLLIFFNPIVYLNSSFIINNMFKIPFSSIALAFAWIFVIFGFITYLFLGLGLKKYKENYSSSKSDEFKKFSKNVAVILFILAAVTTIIYPFSILFGSFALIFFGIYLFCKYMTKR